jgi:ATP-dependent helicase/nuclease subunit A
MEPTSQQQAAITTLDRALLVDAGAGTGKTRVLTERFLHLLEVYPDWPLESIVAVTFTEKAAREMRSRIRTAIEARAQRPNVAAQWAEHRRNLDQLRVATIHSFCARLLRENAIAAGIDPRFELLDEPTRRMLQETALDNVFSRLVETDAPPLQLLASRRITDLRGEIMGLLALRGTVARLFDDLKDSAALLDYWRKQISELYTAIWEQALQDDPYLTTALDTFPFEISDASDKLAPFVEVANAGTALLQEGQLYQAALLFEPIKLNVGSSKAWGGKDELKELKAQLKTLREALKTLLRIGEIGEADAQAADYLQLWRDLWLQVVAEYDHLKRARQAFDFDDLLLLTAQLLQDAPDTPRLQAFRDGINHLMVDEFQDTNVLQKQIIYALAAPENGGRLFVVGDAKQSIYRFLQAQVSVFNATCDEITQATGHPPLPLNQSFRTHDALVKAVNQLFEEVLQPVGDEHASYEAQPGPLHAFRDTHDTATVPVEVLILPKKDSNDETINAETARRWEAHWLAQRLKTLEADGLTVWDKEQRVYRPFRFDDAAILFRATTDIPLYEDAFKSVGLPYLTLSGRGYYDRPEIRDLEALLRGLHNPADDLSLAAVLRSPLFGLSDETLFRLRWSGPETDIPIPYATAFASLPETDQAAAVGFAYETLTRLWRMAGRVNVWRLLREALNLTGYEATLALDDQTTGERQLNNVQKFMAMARSSSDTSLSLFLQQVQDLRTQEVRESEAAADAPQTGAVQLMTIHAAKGLEYPVVVVADMGRKPRTSSNAHILHDPQFGLLCMHRDENGDWQKPASYAWGDWLHKRMEIAEHKRLFYVACTRAADLLLLTGQDSGDDTWLTYAVNAWGLETAGSEEETLSLDGFAVKVSRPLDLPDLDRHDQQNVRLDLPEISKNAAAYDLAFPLMEIASTRPVAVTKAIQQTQVKPQEIQSAVRGKGNRAPASLVGDVVHHALAHWDCLALRSEQLKQWLINDSHRTGITHPAVVQNAVQRSLVMLNHLRHHSLYETINTAQERYTELPVMLYGEHGLVHGSVDLLYQDGDGVWHIIDWKTEYLDGQEHEQLPTHRQQLALYVSAVQRQLAVTPQAQLCFLNPHLKLID